MRKRGNHIEVEHVLLGVIVVIAIVVLALIMGGSQNHVNTAYDEGDETSVYGGASDQIGPQWSAAKQAQVNQLNQKMYHDLELTPIE